MPEFQDIDLGIHKGRRRVLTLNVGDIGVINVNLAAGGQAFSPLEGRLYTPGFTHFAGRLVATTPVVTTLSVLLQPEPGGDGGETGLSFALMEVALIKTRLSVDPQRYIFYWGEARGLLLDVNATNSTFVFSTIWRIGIRNKGADPANSLSIEGIECS